MCSRFSRTVPLDVLLKRFLIDIQHVPSFPFVPRFNIAPSQQVAVVVQRDRRELVEMQWGLIPSWAKEPGARPINARAETLTERPMFRQLLLRQRCLVPADGFYGWQRATGTKQKTPMRFVLKDDDLFAFAGLWDTWRRPDGSELKTFTIVTTGPNEVVRPVHDRMPVILRHEDEAVWLDPNVQDPVRLRQLLVPFAEPMQSYPVSPKVNTPTVDTPDCIERQGAR